VATTLAIPMNERRAVSLPRADILILVGLGLVKLAGLPPGERGHAVILAANFGEAGAIDLYGPSMGLPAPICPEMSYWLWKPAHVDDSTVIVVGATAADVTWAFGDVRVAAPIRIPNGVQNQSEVGRDILIARQPRVSLDEVWPRLLNLN
jgi:hypothetical protein